MKKRNRIVALLIAVVMVMVLATACGPKKPTADDAKAYVKATMDLLCTGDYDHSVQLVDVEEGQEAAVRSDLIAAAKQELMNAGTFSQEAGDAFEVFMDKCFASAKYEVTDAVETEDGYDVTVVVEPLDAYVGSNEFIDNLTPEDIGKTREELQSMTEEEITQLIFVALFQHLTANLDNPTYGAPKEVVVHYGLIDEENNIYGCTEEEGEKIGAALFADN